MKLTWHLIRKDLGSHRWALLFWALLIVAQVGLGFALLRVDHPNLETVGWLERANWLLVTLQFTAGYFLVAQFVQEDALTGTRMFWLTRPVSARRLLAAKALGILLVFAVLPVALFLPWWLYCGLGPRELAWIAVETAGWQLLMIAPAMLISSLTDDLGRVIMWTLLLIAGLVALTVWMQTSLKMALGGPGPTADAGLMFSRLWLVAAILVVGAVIVSIHQFLTRRLVVSLGLIIPMLILMALTSRFWPWDCSVLLVDFNRPESPPPEAAEAFVGVQVSLARAQIRYRDRDNFAPAAQKQEALHTGILQTLEVRGLPGDLMISGRTPAQFWRWQDRPIGARAATFEYWSDSAMRKVLGVPHQPDDPETIRWWRERQVLANVKLVAQGHTPLPLWPRPADGPGMLGFSRLPDSLVEQIQARPPSSELVLQARISRPRIVLEIPLRAGAHASGASQTFRITSVFRSHAVEEHATLAVVLTSPAQRTSGIWGATSIQPGNRDGLPRLVMGLNRSVGDCWPVNLRNNDGGEPLGTRVAGVKIRWAICGITAPEIIREGRWLPRYPGWYEHTSLVVLEEKPVARITREVKTGKFEFAPADTDPLRQEQPF